ncbi:MAG: histidinol-phosphate transaminase [SAR86 cluster bacterium]|jgi:histidinol-phosphate aminotransferase|nr:histidinol-phosphate transaminase [SAR86 cluster bacterium]
MTVNFKKLLNQGIKDLKPYVPGKPIQDLEREFGITNVIKLASNENPLGPSPLALEAINHILKGLNRYPDGNALELKKSISIEYGVNENQITIGNGSNDIIEFVVRSFLSSNDSAVFSKHAFAVYPLAVQISGAEGIEVTAKNWGHDLLEMNKAIKENTKIVFIANPNNPTGTFLSHTEIVNFLKRVRKDVLVFLDQAYFDYSSFEEKDVNFGLVEKFPNLIISRSFSKAYGLAGFRVGYSVSSPEIADYLNRVRQPFNANSLGLAAAKAAISDKDHMQKSLKMNLEQKIQLYKGLEGLGYQYIPTLANFICFDCKHDANERFMDLLKEGVIVRAMGVYKMPNHLRVTIGLPEENSFFLKKLNKITDPL